MGNSRNIGVISGPRCIQLVLQSKQTSKTYRNRMQLEWSPNILIFIRMIPFPILEMAKEVEG